MPKIRLEFDRLHVDSFPTGAEQDGAVPFITQGAQTCYDCTRFGCPGTQLC